MPQIGPLEILVVGVLALLVFGPEKLPEMGRSLGKGLTQLKRMASDVKSEFDMSLDDGEDERTSTPKVPADRKAEAVPEVPTPASEQDVVKSHTRR
ncbi:MAG: Sec-independent protein translocase subunit TatA/TatB [Actinomycetota bacterium]